MKQDKDKAWNVGTSVVEPEPEPQGAETFGRSWYIEVSTPAPGQTKVVYKNHNSH
jgi:hypothetical protein